MAYQTGTATDIPDLLDKLRAFLLANGWTIEAWRFRVDRPGDRWLAVSKSGLFFNFAQHSASPSQATPSTHNLYTGFADSYASGSDFVAQSGGVWGFCLTLTPPYASYHFFEGVGASGPYCYAAVELGVGEFRHFGIGVLDKVGTYTGGQFQFGTTWDQRFAPLWQNYVHGIPFDCSGRTQFGLQHHPTAVRCNEAASPVLYSYSDTSAMLLCSNFRGSSLSASGSEPSNPNYGLWAAGPWHSIASAPLQRIPCFVPRGSGFFSLIGEPPGFRHIDVAYLNPGDEITLGAEVWKTFPVVRKGTGTLINYSNNLGIAYRKS